MRPISISSAAGVIVASTFSRVLGVWKDRPPVVSETCITYSAASWNNDCHANKFTPYEFWFSIMTLICEELTWLSVASKETGAAPSCRLVKDDGGATKSGVGELLAGVLGLGVAAMS